MRAQGQRYTVYGGIEVEAAILALTKEVARLVQRHFPDSTYRALVMLGGYGRGEGGVERRAGREVPHNNVDFLLITEGKAVRAKHREALQSGLRALESVRGVSIDFSFISAGKLRRSPCLVMWYDMRFGHKTVLGDTAFVPSLEQFRVERIDPADVRNLLVNRGTLLLLNDLLLSRGNLTPDERRTVVKHTMKAIIGYGDALLFFLGGYHWSYLARQVRMRDQAGVSPEFRKLYDAAMAFRFKPSYRRYLSVDLEAWMGQVRGLLQQVHLQCEALRVGTPGLTWETYPAVAFSHALKDGRSSLRSLAKKAINFVHGPRLTEASWTSRLGFRSSGPAGVLPLVFPAIAYRLPHSGLRQAARVAVAAASDQPSELRRAYLEQWGRYGDINLTNTLQRLALSLDVKVPLS